MIPPERAALLLAYGDDGFQLSEAMDEFAAQIAALDRTELIPERSPDESLIERAALAAASMPLFGGRHLVVLRQPLRVAGRSSVALDRLVAVIANLPPGAAMAMIEERPSRDVGKTPAALQRLAEAAVAAGGAAVERNAPRRGRLTEWIRRRAERIGVAVEPRAATLLADRIGGAVWEGDIERGEQTRTADTELRKLATYAGRRAITAGDVEALVADARPSSVFAITNAVERRDGRAAAAALDRALRDGQAPLLIMATLQARISDLIVARDLMAHRVPAAEVGRRLGRPPRSAERIVEAARRYSGAELEEMLRGLFQTDVQIKTNAMDARAALASWFGSHVLATADGAVAARLGATRRAAGDSVEET